MSVLSEQARDETQLSKPDAPLVTVDVQLVDAAYDFCQRLKASGLSFRKSEKDSVEDRKCVQCDELAPTAEQQDTDSTTQSSIEELVTGCVYPIYSKTGRRFIVKVSAGGGLETSLLLQARKLRQNNTLEDACLPTLLDHYYHHMSSTNFLILEYCENGTLEKLLAEKGTVPIHRQHIAKILRGVATAIYFLHSQYIYHGTICTANILVDHNMTGRLTGLAKAQELSENMKKNTQLSMYAAPEASRPEAEALPQDMFAMGVVLYRCLIGRMPKRKPNLTIDYHGVKSTVVVAPDKEMWRTTQLLMSERLEMRLTAGQLLHTGWVETAASTPLTQIFNWNN